ncbi:MAG: signal peptidase I [Gammaproteobacteria bacterium]|nr:signal peptidase I [Gammaproteobacteria bacterium]
MVFDFSAVMMLLVVASGLIWALDSWLFAPKRYARFAAAGGGEIPANIELPVPVVVDYARSFFPIFVIVLLLRSFLVEPFRIPSGSMIPTLLVGDFILVNKFTYGLRLPVSNTKFIAIGTPARGDVVVFRYPQDPSTPFIKRIIGLPGDRIAYRNKQVYVNGRPVEYAPLGSYVGQKSAAVHTGADYLEEHLETVNHRILVTPYAPIIDGEYDVPVGQYFVLGDNRDNSRDSRYWGFVPDENLIGRAFMIWMNWDRGPDLSRIGTTIQ